MDWSENIANHLINSAAVVSCITVNYLDSNNCLDELSMGLDNKKKQLILYLDEIMLPLGIQMRISRIQHIERLKLSYDEFLQKLITTPCIQEAIENEKELGTYCLQDAATDNTYSSIPLKSMSSDEWTKYALITLDELDSFSKCTFNGGNWKNNTDGLKIPLGLAYDWAEGNVYVAIADLIEMRNIVISGISDTGKTTLIETFAIALARKYKPDLLNIYVLSLSSKVLRSLSVFPHTGDVLFYEDKEDIRRLLEMLSREYERRVKLFDSVMAYSYCEYNAIRRRKALSELNAIVVFIDDMELFEELTGSEEEDKLDFLAEGCSVGIYFIITAKAPTHIRFSSKYRESIASINLLSGLNTDENFDIAKRYGVPIGVHIAGRGLALVGHRVLETRFAVAFADKYGVDRYRKICELGKEMESAWSGNKAQKVFRIPKQPTYDEFMNTSGYILNSDNVLSLPLAYDIKSGDVHVLDLLTEWSYLITGANDTGKTYTLMCIAKTFAKRGATVLVMGGNQWNLFVKDIGAIKLDPTSNMFSDFLEHTIVEEYIKPRVTQKKTFEINKSRREVAEQFDPIVFIIDDYDEYLSCDGFLKEIVLLKHIFTDARGIGIYSFISMDAKVCTGNLTKHYKSDYVNESINDMREQNRYIVMGGFRGDRSNWYGMSINSEIIRKYGSLPNGKGIVINDNCDKEVIFPCVFNNETEGNNES